MEFCGRRSSVEPDISKLAVEDDAKRVNENVDRQAADRGAIVGAAACQDQAFTGVQGKLAISAYCRWRTRSGSNNTDKKIGIDPRLAQIKRLGVPARRCEGSRHGIDGGGTDIVHGRGHAKDQRLPGANLGRLFDTGGVARHVGESAFKDDCCVSGRAMAKGFGNRKQRFTRVAGKLICGQRKRHRGAFDGYIYPV